MHWRCLPSRKGGGKVPMDWTTTLAERDVYNRGMQYIDQLLHGGGGIGAQRSASTGRQRAAAPFEGSAAIYGGLLDTRGQPGSSPGGKPRSASVGRRHSEEYQQLAAVLQEIQHKGRMLQHVSGELEGGALDNLGSAPTDRNGGAAAGLVDSRAAEHGDTAAAAGSARVLGSSNASLTGAGGGLAHSKSVVRSILGMETLAQKLEKLTPRKSSPGREALSGQPPQPSAWPHGAVGSNGRYRDLLAAANESLLQGQVQDAPRGGRDQSSVAAALAAMPSTAEASRGQGTGVSAAAGTSSKYSGELAASMILQNRRRTAEDLSATDLKLLQLQQQLLQHTGPPAGTGQGSAAIPPQAHQYGGATAHAHVLRQDPEGPRAEVSRAGAAGLGGAGRSRQSGSGGLPASGGGAWRAGESTAGGMLQSFLARLSEAVPPPQLPMAPVGPNETPARPVLGPGGASLGHRGGAATSTAAAVHTAAPSRGRIPDAALREGMQRETLQPPHANYPSRPYGLLGEAGVKLSNGGVPHGGRASVAGSGAALALPLADEIGRGLDSLQKLTQALPEAAPAAAVPAPTHNGRRASWSAAQDREQQLYPLGASYAGHGGEGPGAARVSHAGISMQKAGAAAGRAADGDAADSGLGTGGINMALLLQQRRKERARRDEQDAAAASANAARAQQSAADWRAQHDSLLARYLALRERLEALESEQERIEREGCNSCARSQQQLQEARDAAANISAQLREVQSALVESHAREETLKRQLDRAMDGASEQALTTARLRGTLEAALVELLQLAGAASRASPRGPAASLGLGSHCGGTASAGGASSSMLSPHRPASSAGGASQGQAQAGQGAAAGDLDGMLQELRERLKEQRRVALQQEELLAATHKQMEEQRAAAAYEKQQAEVEAAKKATLAGSEVDFLRERAAALQEELSHQRGNVSDLERRLRQLEDERDRAVRQRDTAEGTVQSQQSQLAAAAAQQKALTARVYEGQRDREDHEVLQSQIRSLTQQLEAAKSSAAHAESLHRRAAVDDVRKEELDSRVEELEALLEERDRALEAARRRLREAEAEVQKAHSQRSAAIIQLQSSQAEVTQLVAENVRMFPEMEKRLADNNALQIEVQRLAAQVVASGEEQAKLRGALSAARDQVAQLQSNPPILDATFAQQRLTGELGDARAQLAALKAARDQAGEYIGTLVRLLRRNGLTVPEAPTVSDMTSHISSLQAKLNAESEAADTARREVTEARQQLRDLQIEVERLRNEVEVHTARYTQLETAHREDEKKWLHNSGRDTQRIEELQSQVQRLTSEVHQLQLAGSSEATELSQKAARFEVQLEAAKAQREDAAKRAEVLMQDLGVLRKVLTEKEAAVESMRLSMEAAKAAAASAAEAQKRAEEEAAQAAKERADMAAELDTTKAEVTRLQDELAKLTQQLDDRNDEYGRLYHYCEEVLGEKAEVEGAAAGARQQLEALGAEAAELRRQVEALQAEVADKEAKLAIKPKMAELQYRVAELNQAVEELTAARNAAQQEAQDLAVKLQDEQEAHFATDGRRVRLGEEVERLRGILRMYSIPF